MLEVCTESNEGAMVWPFVPPELGAVKGNE